MSTRTPNRLSIWSSSSTIPTESSLAVARRSVSGDGTCTWSMFANRSESSACREPVVVIAPRPPSRARTTPLVNLLAMSSPRKTAHERLEHRASPQETQETGHPPRETALRARHYAPTLATPRHVSNACRVDATLRLYRAAPEPIAYASCRTLLRTVIERPVDEDPRDQRVRGGDTVQAGALAAARRARVSHLAGPRLGRCPSGRRCGCRRRRRGADQPKQAYRCLPEGRNRLLPGRGGRHDRPDRRAGARLRLRALRRELRPRSWVSRPVSRRLLPGGAACAGGPRFPGLPRGAGPSRQSPSRACRKRVLYVGMGRVSRRRDRRHG